MSVKLALLKSGETIIADIKELISDEKLCGYLFKKPHVVAFKTHDYLVEEQGDSQDLEVVLSPWIIFTTDTEIPVRTDWVVTVVDAHSDVLKMYEENVNGKADQGSTFIYE